ncbi:hypothetical protein O181_116279 [Austropuccinia psidii MF-1]|uniref:Uncharacterized protein n=1 Tax=Austropuccinia psidii MF-1 TaxID=1389203 RepID=A0A9Q3KB71_9BASI|nr:hypothetical protein [Austropuccinia psidii MF-1]
MPLESLGQIRLNSLNSLLCYLGVQELTIQGKGGTVTTTKIDPPPWVLWKFQPQTNLGPIGHTLSFMANWSPLVPYGHLAISGHQSSFTASGHILPSLVSLANFHITNPQAFVFDIGPGGSFCLLGTSRPPSHLHQIWATPFH